LFFLLLQFGAPSFAGAQSLDVELCGTPWTWEKDVKKNDPVRLCSYVWQDPQHPALLYLRIRRSQSQNGFYEIWQKITLDKLVAKTSTDGRKWWVMNYTFPATNSYHYFLTAVYSEKEAGGSSVLKESTGSAHGRVNVIP